MLIIENAGFVFLMLILLPFQVFCEDQSSNDSKLILQITKNVLGREKMALTESEDGKLDQRGRVRRESNSNPYYLEKGELDRMAQVYRLLSLLNIKGRENEAWVDDLDDSQESLEISSGRPYGVKEPSHLKNKNPMEDHNEYYEEPIGIQSHRPFMRLSKSIWKAPKFNDKEFNSRKYLFNQNNKFSQKYYKNFV